MIVPQSQEFAHRVRRLPRQATPAKNVPTMDAPPPQPSFTVDGNQLTLLDTGPRRLEALIALIDSARISLRVLYYIYVDDHAGERVRAALIAAAARGVQTSLIVDAMGSEPAAARDFFQPLEDAGVSVCRFLPRFGRRYLLRNHQKMAIADAEGDDARTIIGGFNIEDAYFGTPAEQAWRDLGLLVEGPAAARLADYFDALADWTRTPKAKMRTLRHTLKAFSERDGAARWLFGGPTRRLSPWAWVVRQDMKRAQRTDIIAGYFAPSPAMLRRVDKVGVRGTVRLVLPAKTDHGLAIFASRFTYAGLLRKSVEVYEYQPTKLHTKLFLIDDTVHIGSANFDMRSLFLNLELMLRIEDAAFAAHIRRYVDGEIAASERITPELHRRRSGPWTRVKQFAAYFVMAVLDPNVSRRLNFGWDGR